MFRASCICKGAREISKQEKNTLNKTVALYRTLYNKEHFFTQHTYKKKKTTTSVWPQSGNVNQSHSRTLMSTPRGYSHRRFVNVAWPNANTWFSRFKAMYWINQEENDRMHWHLFYIVMAVQATWVACNGEPLFRPDKQGTCAMVNSCCCSLLLSYESQMVARPVSEPVRICPES